MTLGTLIQFQRGTAAQWTTANPVLAAGSPGFETDTRKHKIGDGATAWNSLAYGTAESLQAILNLGDVASTGAARYNLHNTDLAMAVAMETANVASRSGLGAHDGVTPVDGDVILLTGQTTGSQNGPWAVHTGAWTRPTDFPSGGAVKARTCVVIGGTVHAKQIWMLNTTSSITIDTTSQTWSNISSAGGSGGAPPIDVQVFDTSGTWTKPSAAAGFAAYSEVYIALVASGAGGGSGRKGASGSAIFGGAGGGGGGRTSIILPASLCGATETVTVPAGGAGGVATTANDTNGSVGGSGGIVTFGSLVSSGQFGNPVGGGAGSGIAGTGGQAGAGGQAGSAGGNSGVIGGTAPGGGSGGGGAGGLATTPVAVNGFAGGFTRTNSQSGGAGGVAGGAAASAGHTLGDSDNPGTGGGGGASSTTGNGGDGAVGGFPGGGGGGGGAALNSVGNSGAGGAGGGGVAVVITR